MLLKKKIINNNVLLPKMQEELYLRSNRDALINMSQFVSIYFKYLKKPTEKEIIKAITGNGCVLEFVSEDMKTFEVCELAMKQNIKALQFLPDKLKTLELLGKAIENNSFSLDLISTEILEKLIKEIEGNPFTS